MSDDPGATSVLDLMEQLEELVGSARRVPLSASVVVNEDEILELVDRIRLALPEELVQARHTMVDQQRIITGAEEEAEQVLARAEQEAERLVREGGERAATLVSEHVLALQAEQRGREIVAAAEEQAAAIRAEADAYAREVMQRLEEQLGRAMQTVRKGIDTLPHPEQAHLRGRRHSREKTAK